MRRTAHASCKSASTDISGGQIVRIRVWPARGASASANHTTRFIPGLSQGVDDPPCRGLRRHRLRTDTGAYGTVKKRITAPPHIAFTDATEPAVRDTFYAGFYPSKFRLRADRCVSLTGNLRKCLIFMALADVPVFHS